jgi:chorismate mutase
MKKIFYSATLIFIVSVSPKSNAQTAPLKPLTTLEINRKKIDSLDSSLMNTIGLREKLVKEIGLYKAQNHIPPLQAARFQEVLNKAIAAGKQQQLSEVFVTELMNAIHKESLRIENAIKDENK